MTSLDPIPSVPVDSRNTQGKIPDDENYAAELVEIGRRTADSETRDAVTQRYVDEANAGGNTDEALADIARTEAAEAAEDRAEEVGPETDAIHREVPPED